LFYQRRLRDIDHAALERSEARMGVVAASTDTGLWQYDVANQSLWATEHCLAMFGLNANVAQRPEALIGTVHPDDRGAAGAVIGCPADAANSPSCEFRVLNGNGQIRWYLAVAHTERGRAGKPLRVSGVVRDITRRKSAEQTAVELSERLLTLQEKERQQIAEELHDSSTQHLVAIGLNVAQLKKQVPADREALELMDEIKYLADEATKELRSFTYVLHPPRLESDGLCATLRRYVDGFSRRTGIKITVRLNPNADRLSAELQRSMLRIVQEALANVYRHAAAKRARVKLMYVGGHVHLVINDNGNGNGSTFAHNSRNRQNRSGVGVPAMTARMHQFGGKLDIRSGPKGTTVHAVVPVEAGQALVAQTAAQVCGHQEQPRRDGAGQ
jgi:PAS domain S-box-containing protein